VTRHLDLGELLGLARRLGEDEVRDHGLLESALARPRAGVFGQDAYADVWHKAAALMESVGRNHAMVDGNKRLSWYATWVFLQINGHTLDPRFDVDAAEALVVAAAQGQLGLAEIAGALPGFARPDSGHDRDRDLA
jgi:death on curing protein